MSLADASSHPGTAGTLIQMRASISEDKTNLKNIVTKGKTLKICKGLFVLTCFVSLGKCVGCQPGMVCHSDYWNCSGDLNVQLLEFTIYYFTILPRLILLWPKLVFTQTRSVVFSKLDCYYGLSTYSSDRQQPIRRIVRLSRNLLRIPKITRPMKSDSWTLLSHFIKLIKILPPCILMISITLLSQRKKKKQPTTLRVPANPVLIIIIFATMMHNSNYNYMHHIMLHSILIDKLLCIIIKLDNSSKVIQALNIIISDAIG